MGGGAAARDAHAAAGQTRYSMRPPKTNTRLASAYRTGTAPL